MDASRTNKLKGVHLNNIFVVGDLLILKILLYDKNIVDGNILGVLARQTVQKYHNTVGLLKYNNHLYYLSNLIAIFHFFCCDTFFIRTFNSEQSLTGCSEVVENVYPRNVYETQEPLYG